MNQATKLQLQESFARLSNPLKMEIFLKLAQEGCECDLDNQEGYEGNCVSAIVDELKIPQSTASMYIKDLQDSGLIVCKRGGKFLYCKPNIESLRTIKSFFDGILLPMEAK